MEWRDPCSRALYRNHQPSRIGNGPCKNDVGVKKPHKACVVYTTVHTAWTKQTTKAEEKKSKAACVREKKKTKEISIRRRRRGTWKASDRECESGSARARGEEGLRWYLERAVGREVDVHGEDADVFRPRRHLSRRRRRYARSFQTNTQNRVR
jgi:hypothetical protein